MDNTTNEVSDQTLVETFQAKLDIASREAAVAKQDAANERRNVANERRNAANDRRNAANDRRIAQIALRDAAIARGTFYTTIDELWSSEKVRYANAFERVRRAEKYYETIASYKPIVEAVLDKRPPLPRLDDNPNSTGPSSSGARWKTSIFGKKDTERAHLRPDSKICSPTYGVFVQAVLGVDLENHHRFSGLKRKELIPALQQVASGRRDNRRFGLKHSPLNILMMPPNHRKYFDEEPLWIVVPLLSLNDVKKWGVDQEYWVMAIAGTLPSHDRYSDSDVYEALVTVDYDDVTRKKCTPEDINVATELVGEFVKAHAEVLMGRRAKRPNSNKPIKPLELFLDKFTNITEYLEQEVRKKETKLERTNIGLKDSTVKVPKLTNGGDECEVMKVFLKGDSVLDPALVAMKAAISWSMRCGQKLLPACPVTDEEEDELDVIAREHHEASREANLRPLTPTPWDWEAPCDTVTRSTSRGEA